MAVKPRVVCKGNINAVCRGMCRSMPNVKPVEPGSRLFNTVMSLHIVFFFSKNIYVTCIGSSQKSQIFGDKNIGNGGRAKAIYKDE